VRTSVYNSSIAKATLAPALRAATANGTTVDRMSNELSAFRSAMLAVNVGTVTDGTHAFKLQDSPNNSDWTDVAAGFLQGSAISVTSANDEALFELGYTGHQRYLRAVVTVTGAPATGGVYGAVLVLSGARRTPIPRS
jgi:hypothetical protein